MRPSTPTGVVISNALKVPGLALKPASPSPISKSLIPAVRSTSCARVLVAAAPPAGSVVGFQRVPSQRSTTKFAGVAPASYSVAPPGNLNVASMRLPTALVLSVVAVIDQ